MCSWNHQVSCSMIIYLVVGICVGLVLLSIEGWNWCYAHHWIVVVGVGFVVEIRSLVMVGLVAHRLDLGCVQEPVVVEYVMHVLECYFLGSLGHCIVDRIDHHQILGYLNHNYDLGTVVELELGGLIVRGLVVVGQLVNGHRLLWNCFKKIEKEMISKWNQCKWSIE